MSAAPARSTAPGDLASALDAILRRHGMGLLDKPSRLFALLRDYAPESPRDIRVLMTALESGAPDRLRAGGVPASEATLAAETARMVDLFGCTPPLARAALETWSRSVAGQGTGLVQPLPGPEPVAVLPLPVPGVPAVAVQPLPVPGGAGQMRPLPLPGPAAVAVKPLPLPLSGAASQVRPLPLPAAAPRPIRPPPLPGSTEAAQPKGWFARWAPLIGAVLLLIAAAVRLLGQL